MERVALSAREPEEHPTAEMKGETSSQRRTAPSLLVVVDYCVYIISVCETARGCSLRALLWIFSLASLVFGAWKPNHLARALYFAHDAAVPFSLRECMIKLCIRVREEV